jgi:hypothetical protein
MSSVSTLFSPRAIWFEPDWEPDDMIALYVFLKRGYSLAQLVVGEGDANIKMERALSYWDKLHAEFPDQVATEPAVLRGCSSKKPFADDGLDVSEHKDEVDALLVRAAARNVDDDATICAAYQEHFIAYLEAHDHPLVIQCKPMRELVRVWQNVPDALRRKTTLAQYGSFNYRSLLDRADPAGSSTRIEAMLRGFGHTVVYESFIATGTRNNLTRDSQPTFYASLDCIIAAGTSPFLTCLKRLVLSWNQHSLVRCPFPSRSLPSFPPISLSSVAYILWGYGGKRGASASKAFTLATPCDAFTPIRCAARLRSPDSMPSHSPSRTQTVRPVIARPRSSKVFMRHSTRRWFWPTAA